jgi:hypothetical protein
MKTKHLKTLYFRSLKMLSSIIFIYVLAGNASAQVYYNYDNNGNRLNESMTVLPPKIIAGGHKNDSTPKDTTTNTVTTIKVYPNPTASQVNVAISSFQGCEYATMYLLDATGNLLSTQKSASTISQINLSGYSGNIFYLRILMCDFQYSYTLLKASPGNGTPSTSKPSVEK